MNEYDVIIIGAGPAGLSAAIYTIRRELKTLVLSEDIGGQVSKTFVVENYPGIRSISGPDLGQKFSDHAKDFGVEIKLEKVDKIVPKGKKFIIKTDGGEYISKSIILAFGKEPRNLNVAGEDKFMGKGISHCAICDGPLFRNKTVAVVGGANSAVTSALQLSDMAKKVYLINRDDKLDAYEYLINYLNEKKNVEIVHNKTVEKFVGDKMLHAIKIKDVKTKKIKELAVDGVFEEVGYVVNPKIVKGLVKLDEHNHIVITNKCETYFPDGKRIRPGIYAAGDVTPTLFNQIVIAAGQGAIAGLQVYNYLKGID